MPYQPIAPAPAGYRALVVLLLLLGLGTVYTVYLKLQNADLTHRNEYITKVYGDSTQRRAAPAQIVRVPVPGPVVRVPVPPTAAQLASIRQALALDLTQQLRREVARLVPKPARPATVTLKQPPMVLALHDSVRVARKPGTNQLSLTTLKTGSFQDKWLTLSTVVRPGKNGRPDSLEMKYQLRNEYDAAAWYKRTKHRFWPFGKRRIYVTLTSRNPNAHDQGLESIPVKKATKKP